MAKQTKSAVNPAAGTPPAEGTAPVEKKTVNIKEPNGADQFKRVMVDGKGSALTKKNAKGEIVPCSTPQVKVIANVLEAAGEAGMSRKDLVAALPGAGLVTRQPVGRIVSYYQKDMVDNGIIVIVKAPPTVAPPPPVAAEVPAA